MKSRKSPQQADLFETQAGLLEPPPVDFVARIRDELIGTLAQVRVAAELPWKDLTAATLAELRFDSIAGWLPPDEAARLRAEFHRELDRLYAGVSPAVMA
jgi:hypothetical protein